jgi:putative tricarboxylic transport membrane protein
MGVMGLFMRVFDFPTAPVIIGMILGPLAEQEFRRAMTISQGDMMIFLQKPLSLGLLVIAVLAVLGPQLWRLRRGTNAPAAP